MTYPTLAVEVAFDDDPLDTTVTWTAITAYVRSVKTRVGRNNELDTFPPGTCTLVLDNTTRRFDPLHSSGPYYGKLTAGKRIRVRATHNAVTYTLFVGWVDGWPQDYSSAAPTITVTCTDAFKQLARLTLPGSVYEQTVVDNAPWLWWRFLEESGTAVADHSGNGRHATCTRELSTIDKQPTRVKGSDSVMLVQQAASANAWTIAQDLLEAAGSFTFTIEAWVGDRGLVAYTYLAWDIASNLADGYTIGPQPHATYTRRLAAGDVGSNTDLTRTTSDVLGDDDIHHVVIVVDATTVDFFVDGVGMLKATVGAQPYAPTHWQWSTLTMTANSWSGTPPKPMFMLGEFAVYDYELTALDVLAHYQAAITPWDGDLTGARINRVLDLFGWPAGLKDIATGQTTLGPAFLDRRNALAYLQATAAAEGGHLYCDPANSGKLTFRDRHHRLTNSRATTVQYELSDQDTGGVYHYEDLDLRYDEADIVNVVEVRWQGGTVTVENAASVTTYGRATRTVDTELRSRNEAEELGNWILGRYATPLARCRNVTLNPAAYQSSFLPALDLRIGDRVTVRKLPQGVGSAIEKDLLVEGIEHDIDQGVNRWTTTIKTSEADAGPWFVWGTATWDETTRWAW